MGELERVRSERIATPAGVVDGTLVVSASGIEGIEPPGPADLEVAALVPGLIDLQVNGGWGIDLAHEPGRANELARLLPGVGVTAWLPTLISSPEAKYGEAVGLQVEGEGAQILGWHLEGPWLSPARAGAHRPESLSSPPDRVPDWYAPPAVRMVTLAPEVAGGEVGELVRRGIVVSLGHTEAPSVDTRAAWEQGATMGTHLFNAMSGLHHRSPGVAAELLNGEFELGLIADGYHVAPEMIDLVWRLASDRVVLVSDAIAGLGLTPGSTVLGGAEVFLDGVTARLGDGTLAGSVLPLLTAVQNLSRFTGCSTERAFAAASEAPARVIGDRSRGTIEVGKRADLLLLDENGELATTIIGGRISYQRGS